MTASISCAYIPQFLHESDFYKALSEDSSEIEIPADCYKENDHVRNVQELEELLKVLRFWGVETIPISVVSYCFETSASVWEDVARSFQQELRYMLTLQDICAAQEQDQLQLAVQSGRIEIVQFVFEMHPQPFARNSRDERVNIYEETAALGHLNLLQYFYESSIPITSETEQTDQPRTSKISRTLCAVMWNRDTHNACYYAASNGHLACLKYLQERGCDCDMQTAVSAAQHGHLDCLKYAVEHADSYKDSGVAYFTAVNGHLSCLQYAVENDFPVSNETIDICGAEGHTECIKFLYRNGFKRYITSSTQLLFGAVTENHLDLMQFLHENGAPLHNDLPRIAASSGSTDCLRYAIEHGCTVPANILSVAATSGNIDCIKYLVITGYKITKMVIDKAYAHARTECVQYLHDHLIQASIDANAARNEDLKVLICVKNAYKYGCKWNDDIILLLEKEGYSKCIEFAQSRGYVPKITALPDTVFDLPSL